jgi:hypothetical protein
MKFPVIAAAAVYDRDIVVPRKEQLANSDVGLNLREIEAAERPELKNIAELRPAYKVHCAQWNSPVVRDGFAKRHWDSYDVRSKTAQIFIPRSKAKEMLEVLHTKSSVGHLSINKLLDKGIGNTGYTPGISFRSGTNNAISTQQAGFPQPVDGS